MNASAVFHPATQRWFENNFDAATAVQARGWASIAAGRHSLLVAPTGSGKTLAAFLAGIDALGRRDAAAATGVRVLYVSPLKALVYDIERNLRAPLAGIGRVAETLDTPFRVPTVAVRTGDTPQRERNRQQREPGDILVTTPESLYLLLGSKAAATLHSVDTIILDEIHVLAPSKRGAHLALSLERLAARCEADPLRIGLSATVRPLDVVARFLGGRRPVDVIDCSAPPKLTLEVSVPVPDMQNPPLPAAPAAAPGDEDATGDGADDEDALLAPDSDGGAGPGGSILGKLYAREVGRPAQERGIWPSIYPQLLERIRANRSSIVFVNSRGLCERLSQKLNELAGEALVRAHHGSISQEQRRTIEEGLKRGDIRGIVATSSLELGIDMGAVDLVMLVESPGSVARGLQRVGRAGHQVGAESAGCIFPKFRGDLLECAVVSQRMLSGELEALAMPSNPLDVLAQQIVAMVCEQPRTVDEIAATVRGAAPYRELSRPALEAVLDMLSGHYPSADFADLRPLLAWDRSEDRLSPRRGAPMVMRMNAGTIPDRGAYGVHLGEGGPRVGELDEEMVFETRAGDVILLGASSWRVEGISRDQVIVSPAPGEAGRLPFWRGDGPGRPLELGRAMGAFLRRLAQRGEEKMVDWLLANTPLDAHAAGNLAAYVSEQKAHTGSLPTDRRIVVERFRDELGDWRVCILTPFGARIHAPWAMALQQRLGEAAGFEMQVMYTDDGIVLRFADAEELPALDTLLPAPEEVEDLITGQLANTSLFAGLFRENAVRALLVRRRRPGQRAPLWAQRLKAQSLLATVRQYPNFPVVIETYRHALADVFDLPGLKQLLGDLRSRSVSVDDVETPSASPFARSLVFAYVAAYLYEQDAPLAERKAQALTLDRSLLAELLGQAELRDLIDPAVLAALEAELQHRADGYRARDADEAQDLLRRLGDLTEDELAARSERAPGPWLAALERQRRAVPLRIGGEPRWVAAEDAGLFRDALGVAPPPGLPDAFLGAAENPLRTLARRFARHRGPFLTGDFAARYGLRDAQVMPVLDLLARDGALVRGELRPGGNDLDWCDAEVLRRLKRRNLAALRDEVAPVDAATLALFLPHWHALTDRRGGADGLEEAIGQLQGLALPWSAWSTLVLPQRVKGFSQEQLDTLAASGRVVWVGRGASGPRDGRVALYLRRQVRDLLPPPARLAEPGPVQAAIIDGLRERGASFQFELEERVRELCPSATGSDFREALWDLVWAGQISNDTFGPLRELAGSGPRRRRPRHRPGGGALGGRWSLVSTLTPAEPNATAQAVARVNLLLDRYGVVSRDCLRAEDLPGGFAPLYKVLREMEEQGRARRGHFVDGLTGAQFAYPGAVDRLRACRADAEERDAPAQATDVVCVPAMDPANPYGTLLPWPEVGGGATPRRTPGAWLLLLRGRPVLYAGKRFRQLQLFPQTLRDEDGALAAALEALRSLPRGSERSLRVIEKIDGVAALDSDWLPAFRDAGWERDYRGLVARDAPPAATRVGS